MRRLKSPLLYPFLFALYVVLAPLANNLDQIPLDLAVRPLAVLLGAALAAWLLFYALTRDTAYAAYLVFLPLAFFFTFGHLNRLASGQLPGLSEIGGELEFLLVGVLLFVLLALKPVWAALGGRTWLPPFLNVALLAALALPIARIAAEELPRLASTATAYVIAPDDANAFPLPGTGGDQTGSTPDNALELDCSNRPDIYLILMDAYGRSDVLADLYGADNRPFLDFLREKGFYVAEGSHTNYTQTIFSVPSVLNFDYIDPPEDSVDDGQYLLERIRGNELMRLLRACGYRVAVLESGFYYTDHFDADYVLTGSGLLNEFESLLLASTPADLLAIHFRLDTTEQSHEAHRQRTLDGLSQLRRAYQIPGPKIVFAHLILPHPPFIFDASGRPVEPPRDYSIADGDEYGGDLEEYKAGYSAQLEFANRRLRQAVSALLAHSKKPPVIIIQGDHGPGSRHNWSSPDESCLWERSGILNAYYLPKGLEQLYPSISPVNSFRVVLNAVFGTDLPLLPDRTYFTSHRLERQALDITDRRDLTANCQPR